VNGVSGSVVANGGSGKTQRGKWRELVRKAGDDATKHADDAELSSAGKGGTAVGWDGDALVRSSLQPDHVSDLKNDPIQIRVRGAKSAEPAGLVRQRGFGSDRFMLGILWFRSTIVFPRVRTSPA